MLSTALLTVSLQVVGLQISNASESDLISSLEGTITKISDGDTVRFKPDAGAVTDARNKDIAVRLIGIDTPEMHLVVEGGGTVGQGHWGDDATRALEKIIPVGTRVTLVSSGVDRYGRTLGQIIKGSMDVNLEMVRLGMAVPYIICEGKTCTHDWVYSRETSDYLAACTEAQTAGRGVYDKDEPLTEMPFEFRLRMQKRKADKYVGDFQSGLYYAPSEYKKVDLCSRIFFMKETDAPRVGFKKAQ